MSVVVPTGAVRDRLRGRSTVRAWLLLALATGGLCVVAWWASQHGPREAQPPQAADAEPSALRVPSNPEREAHPVLPTSAFFPPESILLASSETGYDVSFEDGVGWRIVKVNREYGPGGEVSRTAEVWSRQVRLPDSGPWLPPILSRDGAWLGVWGSEFEILNTTTGSPVARLSEDEEGDEGIGFEFRGDRLLAYSREGEYVAVHAMVLNGEDDNSRTRIVGRLRNEPVIPESVGGILNDYSLEFDWDRTPGPSLRLAVCSEDVPLFGALRVQDGRLMFKPGSENGFP